MPGKNFFTPSAPGAHSLLPQTVLGSKFCPGCGKLSVLVVIQRFGCIKLNPGKFFSPVEYAPGRWRAAPPPRGTRRSRLPLCTGCLRHSRQGKSWLLYHTGVLRDVSQSVISLITRAVGACRQRKMPAPGTHGRFFAGCGHSVRGHILPSGCYVRARVRVRMRARNYCYLSCSGSISCSLRNSQLLLVLSASVI